MPFLRINDIDLYYEESGDRSAQPLILMHGGMCAIDDPEGGWVDLAPSLRAHFHVFEIEHRAHGRTNNPADETTYTMIAADLAAFLTELELAPAHLAGMSDGGIVALQIGIERPELARTLVCVGANYCVDDAIREQMAGFTIEEAEQKYPEWIATLTARHDRGKPAGSWRKTLQTAYDNACVNPAFTLDDLRSIPLPTLLIAGEQDPYAHIDQMVAMKRTIPGAEWLIVNNAGHTVQHTHPEIVGPRMLDFLHRHSAPATTIASGQ